MTCGLCELRIPPVHSEMFCRSPGAAPICAVCDRMSCGKCKTMLLAGNETRCPNCRSAVRRLPEIAT